MNSTEINVRRKLKTYNFEKNKIELLGIYNEEIIKKINFIDSCLEMFSTTDKKFIIDVYILNKTYDEINYSKSNFYHKKMICNNTLNDMLNDIKW